MKRAKSGTLRLEGAGSTAALAPKRPGGKDDPASFAEGHYRRRALSGDTEAEKLVRRLHTAAAWPDQRSCRRSTRFHRRPRVLACRQVPERRPASWTHWRAWWPVRRRRPVRLRACPHPGTPRGADPATDIGLTSEVATAASLGEGGAPVPLRPAGASPIVPLSPAKSEGEGDDAGSPIRKSHSPSGKADPLPQNPMAGVGVPGLARARGGPDRSKELAGASRAHVAASDQLASSPSPPVVALAPDAGSVPPMVLALPAPPPTESRDASPRDGQSGGSSEIVGVKGDPRRSARPMAESAFPMARDAEPPAIAKSAEMGAAVPARVVAGEPPFQAAASAASASPTGAAPATPSPQPAHAIPTPPSTVAAPAPSPHLPARSPASQVTPVMVSLASGGAGTHRLVLRLDPPELGRLEIRMVRAPETGARVEVTVERPATLLLLRQDEPALHRALSDAGVPAEGRSVTMQLGHPGGQDLAGQGGGGQGWSPRRSGGSSFGSAAGSGAANLQLPALAVRELRGALDITA